MDKMMYVAMSGARQVMLKQASNSHNLANLNTNGFKADIDSFKALPVYGPGQPGRVYGENLRSGVDLSPGQLISTGVPLDVALDGDGFIAVQDIDGTEAYTRNGSMRVTEQGLLVTSSGDPVLGEGGPITLSPYNNLHIGSDGTVTIRPLGQTGGELAVIDRIKLVKPDQGEIKRNERGLFTTPNDEEPADASVTLATESLETSNVNSVEALVTMIELSRQYETQVKMMTTAKENDVSAAQLLKIS
ncbi:flagellar basal-body rod protein FlgF [Granulosicoccus antarcticus]|uniref:Flagellar basal-body rod protein FlgF n=1 Tax=Granulosicoccus antarcticus IMCC3135 TaxID=1192854 RepID=A0A2Z2NKG8_9GAMM|nr:flagellar basal-body rod protein FlgF [Granulosicoccus antarcticus]ASJ71806.1 Flagellar basal-body rod protein FlgF [Granulosicoccus antarcticus IMCC3135]